MSTIFQFSTQQYNAKQVEAAVKTAGGAITKSKYMGGGTYLIKTANTFQPWQQDIIYKYSKAPYMIQQAMQEQARKEAEEMIQKEAKEQQMSIAPTEENVVRKIAEMGDVEAQKIISKLDATREEARKQAMLGMTPEEKIAAAVTQRFQEAARQGAAEQSGMSIAQGIGTQAGEIEAAMRSTPYSSPYGIPQGTRTGYAELVLPEELPEAERRQVLAGEAVYIRQPRYESRSYLDAVEAAYTPTKEADVMELISDLLKHGPTGKKVGEQTGIGMMTLSPPSWFLIPGTMAARTAQNTMPDVFKLKAGSPERMKKTIGVPLAIGLTTGLDVTKSMGEFFLSIPGIKIQGGIPQVKWSPEKGWHQVGGLVEWKPEKSPLVKQPVTTALLLAAPFAFEGPKLSEAIKPKIEPRVTKIKYTLGEKLGVISPEKIAIERAKRYTLATKTEPIKPVWADIDMESFFYRPKKAVKPGLMGYGIGKFDIKYMFEGKKVGTGKGWTLSQVFEATEKGKRRFDVDVMSEFRKVTGIDEKIEPIIRLSEGKSVYEVTPRKMPPVPEGVEPVKVWDIHMKEGYEFPVDMTGQRKLFLGAELGYAGERAPPGFIEFSGKSTAVERKPIGFSKGKRGVRKFGGKLEESHVQSLRRDILQAKVEAGPFIYKKIKSRGVSVKRGPPSEEMQAVLNRYDELMKKQLKAEKRRLKELRKRYKRKHKETPLPDVLKPPKVKGPRPVPEKTAKTLGLKPRKAGKLSTNMKEAADAAMQASLKDAEKFVSDMFKEPRAKEFPQSGPHPGPKESGWAKAGTRTTLRRQAELFGLRRKAGTSIGQRRRRDRMSSVIEDVSNMERTAQESLRDQLSRQGQRQKQVLLSLTRQKSQTKFPTEPIYTEFMEVTEVPEPPSPRSPRGPGVPPPWFIKGKKKGRITASAAPGRFYYEKTNPLKKPSQILKWFMGGRKR